MRRLQPEPDTTGVPFLNDLERQVFEVLRAHVRPLLKVHGGGVTLLSIDPDGCVELEFEGACRGCALQTVTYVVAVRQRLMEVPGVTEVLLRGLRVSEAALKRTEDTYRGYSFRLGCA
jgi:Fe-S cluster biogenesis protein NfuA